MDQKEKSPYNNRARARLLITSGDFQGMMRFESVFRDGIDYVFKNGLKTTFVEGGFYTNNTSGSLLKDVKLHQMDEQINILKK